jgi:hypothetical protein
MTPEFQILKRSGIYRLSNNPEGSTQLTLHRMGRRFVCGNPLIAMIFTLGFVPVKLPARWTFAYDLERNGKAEEVIHFLPLYDRFSIWEWPLRWNQQRVYARALAVSSPQQPEKLLHSTPR